MSSRPRTNKWIFTTGVVLVVAAAVGGGVSVAGIDIPVVGSVVRQFIVGVIGVMLIGLSFLVHFHEEVELDAGRDPAKGLPPAKGRPPVFDEARDFAAAASFAEKKEYFIAPLEASIKGRARELSLREREDCAKSSYDLDRVALYLAADYQDAVPLDELLWYVEREEERVKAHGTEARSLVPLHYAVRAFRHRLEREPSVSAEVAVKAKNASRDMLTYLEDHKGLDTGHHVKRNLRAVLGLLAQGD